MKKHLGQLSGIRNPSCPIPQVLRNLLLVIFVSSELESVLLIQLMFRLNIILSACRQTDGRSDKWVQGASYCCTCLNKAILLLICKRKKNTCLWNLSVLWVIAAVVSKLAFQYCLIIMHVSTSSRGQSLVTVSTWVKFVSWMMNQLNIFYLNLLIQLR